MVNEPNMSGYATKSEVAELRGQVHAIVGAVKDLKDVVERVDSRLDSAQAMKPGLWIGIVSVFLSVLVAMLSWGFIQSQNTAVNAAQQAMAEKMSHERFLWSQKELARINDKASSQTKHMQSLSPDLSYTRSKSDENAHQLDLLWREVFNRIPKIQGDVEVLKSEVKSFRDEQVRRTSRVYGKENP